MNQCSCVTNIFIHFKFHKIIVIYKKREHYVLEYVYSYDVNGWLPGLYMLWWGWLAFNAGSTFGISGNKWRLSAKVKDIVIVLQL